MDYRYSYKGQKPHAVSSIIDNNTETLFTYTYDASGNNLLETNSKASADRKMVWTEDNRLAAIKAGGSVSHYLYDANGIRTLKMSSSSFNISVNGVAAGSSAVDGNFTIYANPYAVVRKNQYTKHYFLGAQRILTKIGSNSVEKTFFEGNAKAQVESADYEGKQSELEGKITLNNKLLNVGWYRETRGRVPSPYIKHYLRSKEHGGLSGTNPWAEDDATNDNDNSTSYEEKQYYFHPDHLGSTNYLTDVTGEAYQHVAYLPWGEVFVEQRNTQSSRNTFLYTGKELDEETGLYYVEQRYYDPNKSVFLGCDELMEHAPGWTPYRYGFNNPIRYTDPTGMFEELYINSEENGQAEAATRELQKSTNLQLTRDAETGKITAIGEAKTIGDQKLLEVINSTDIKVEVNATSTVQTSEGNLFIGGAFMGNTVTKTENGNTVVANQEVNPQVLGRMSKLNGVPGQDMLHEVTEAYAGSKISQKSGVSSPNSKTEGTVYKQAHNHAVPQSGTVVENVNPSKTAVTYSTTPYLKPIGGQIKGLQPVLKVTF